MNLLSTDYTSKVAFSDVQKGRKSNKSKIEVPVVGCRTNSLTILRNSEFTCKTFHRTQQSCGCLEDEE